MTWNELAIARAVATGILDKKCLVMVDRCNWTGNECDVLAVTQNLRVIDVEIKISRADFKRDAAKDKWWRRLSFSQARAAGLVDGGEWDPWRCREQRPWPAKVWKHYIVMPAAAWADDLLEFAPSPASGILLMRDPGSSRYDVRRAAKPNRDAETLKPEHVVDIARLANLRMWDAYAKAGAA